MLKPVITVADLMTILCDCVDSGTLDMDSIVIIHSESLDYYDREMSISCSVNGHNVLATNGKKYLRLTGVYKG